jgi:branched-chain amino acid transport system permease protein
MSLILQLLTNGAINGILYAILAVGFGVVFLSTGFFHVAYGSSFILSAFIFLSLVTHGGFGWWSAGILSFAASAGIGCLMELLFFGPLTRRKTMDGGMMVASLGLFAIIENLLALLYGNELLSIPREFSPVLRLGTIQLTGLQIGQATIGATVLASVLLMQKSRCWQIIRAMGDNRELILIQGGRLGFYRTLLFMLSGAIGAIPACLIMVDVGLTVHEGMSFFLVAVVSVLIGGVKRLDGWIIGGISLGILQALVTWQFSTKWMDLVAFTILIVTLLIRPEGLLDFRKRAEEN